MPTATPMASDRASTPTSACSITPATGIIAKAITSTIVNGLPLTQPREEDHEEHDCRQQDAGDGVVLQQRDHHHAGGDQRRQ